MRLPVCLFVSLALFGCGPGEEGPTQIRELQQAVKGVPKTSPVIDHGGTVLSASKTYALYWGPSANFPADLETGMASLLGGFNGSAYLGIAGQYMRGAPLSTAYAGAFADTSAPPAGSPNTSTLAAEVCSLFPTPDPNGLYIVFTSNAPKGASFCAWHNVASCNGVTFQVAYVPNQELIPGCSPYTVSNLGCNAYSVGTVSSADSVAHEFMESISDAHIDAWYDKNKAEIGDKCNFNYQACVTLPNSSTWQIQSIWSNATLGCQQ